MGQYIQTLLVGASLMSVVLARTARVLASPDIPITSFSCAGRPIGYYADVENSCQTYHMCGEKGEMYSYACPNTTLFHQRMLICAHWYQVNCSRSTDDYSANLLIGQRDKPFVDDITANDLNGIQTGENLQKLGNLAARDGKSFIPQRSAINYAQPTQVTYSSQVPHQDLLEAPSGSFFPDRTSRTTQRTPSAETRSAFYGNQFEHLQAITPSRTTSSVTEPTGAVFRPTNVSFRSTIETPNSELEALARTAPMTSAAQPSPSFGRTESSAFFRSSAPSSSAQPPVRNLAQRSYCLFKSFIKRVVTTGRPPNEIEGGNRQSLGNCSDNSSITVSESESAIIGATAAPRHVNRGDKYNRTASARSSANAVHTKRRRPSAVTERRTNRRLHQSHRQVALPTAESTVQFPVQVKFEPVQVEGGQRVPSVPSDVRDRSFELFSMSPPHLLEAIPLEAHYIDI